MEGILPKGPYPPDRALLAGYPRYVEPLKDDALRHFNRLKKIDLARITLKRSNIFQLSGKYRGGLIWDGMFGSFGD